MAPASSANDANHGTAAHSIPAGYVRARCQVRQGAKVPHIRCRQTGLVVTFADLRLWHWRLSPLRSHVSEIVSPRALKEVRRVDAQPVVTTVTETVSGPRSVCQEPGYAMCQPAVYPVPGHAVAIIQCPPRPNPASVRLLDPAPKTCDLFFVHGIRTPVVQTPAASTARGHSIYTTGVSHF